MDGELSDQKITRASFFVNSIMALTLTLDQRDEQIVAAHLLTGRYRSPQEVVAHALETLSEKEPIVLRSKKTPAEVSPTSASCVRA